jgi:hypothetical protein
MLEKHSGLTVVPVTYHLFGEALAVQKHQEYIRTLCKLKGFVLR